MIENKVKGLAKLGASITVIIAFFINYLIGLVYEWIIEKNKPNSFVYVGLSLSMRLSLVALD